MESNLANRLPRRPRVLPNVYRASPRQLRPFPQRLPLRIRISHERSDARNASRPGEETRTISHSTKQPENSRNLMVSAVHECKSLPLMYEQYLVRSIS
jgi:hypothetical protein